MDVVVPQVGEAVAEIRLVRWLKEQGDAITKGEPLFELDTDKYVIEVEAVASGTLAEIFASPGSEVEPLQVVARLVPSDQFAAGRVPPPHAGGTANPVERHIGADSNPAQVAEPDDLKAAAQVSATSEHRVAATPKARRLARELGVNLATLVGTGQSGMVTGDDVERAAASRTATVGMELSPEELSRQERVVGARMQKSKQTVPHFYLLVDVDMTAAVQLRERCRTEPGWAHLPTYTDLVLAASAAAIARDPSVNVTLIDGQRVRRPSINIGIAVAADDGVVVPVVPQADRLDLRTLVEQARVLAERARARRLTPADTVEKSMVVSNLGMHGVDAFLAIIDPPDPLILAVGRVADRCVPIGGGDVGVRPACTLGLSVDHRLLDGVDGARFLALVREALEMPEQLLGGNDR